MDPLTTTITTILGKYAIDKGATLLKEAGQAAANAAAKLFQKVLDRLKADPAEAKNAERFEKDPAKHQELIGEVIDEKVQADPAFKAELQSLLAEFHKAGGGSILSTVSGDIFTGDNAFKVDTNTGTIIYGGSGSTNTVTSRSGGVDISGTANIAGDVVGRDKKT